MTRGRAFVFKHKTLIISLGFLVLFGATVSYASPPTSPYNPGQTLDPSCAPGDSNCTVELPHSPWTVTGNDIYYNTGNVGIGTTTPQTELDLEGDGSILATGTISSGIAVPDLGAGTRLEWIPNASAFRAGTVTGTDWDSSNVGVASVAMGYDTTASGEASTAFGAATNAIGENATTFGYITTASAENSTAFGHNTTASAEEAVAFGSNSTASGQTSTAFGDTTTASGSAATSFGSNTVANNNGATAFGINTQASGIAATSFGRLTTASDDYATASGYNTTASGLTANAFNYSTTAAGAYSNAFGLETTAPSINSFALGQYNVGNGTADGTTWVSTDPIFEVGNGNGVSGDPNQYNDALAVLKNGNVGIGTATPTYPLDVNGDARVSGNLILTNNGYAQTISNNLTADRAISFPDESGTVALTSDLSGYLSLNGSDQTVVQAPNFSNGLDMSGGTNVPTGENSNASAYGFTSIYGSDAISIQSGGYLYYQKGSLTSALKWDNQSANRTIQLPDESGTVALTTDLAGYVPYTGATSSVNIGANQLISSNSIVVNRLNTGTGLQISDATDDLYNIQGAGMVRLQNGEGTIHTQLSQTNLEYGNNGFTDQLSQNTLSANRSISLPDESGTVVLTTDLAGYVPYTGADADVDLGSNNLSAAGLTGNVTTSTNGSGTLSLYGNIIQASGSMDLVPGSGTVYTDGTFVVNSGTSGNDQIAISNNAILFGTNGNVHESLTLNAPTTNNNDVITFPDESGTVALTTDLSGYLTLGGSNQNITQLPTFTNGLTSSSGIENTGTLYQIGNIGIHGASSNGVVVYNTAGTSYNEFNYNGLNFGGLAGGFSQYLQPTTGTLAASETISLPNGSGTLVLDSANNTFTGTNQFGTSSTITGSTVATFENAGGTCNVVPSTTGGITCSSDMNLKKNITNLSDGSAWSFNNNITPASQSILDEVLALNPVDYNWNVEADGTPKHAGFIAQEVQQVFPDLVQTDPNTHLLSLDYTGFIPYTIEAIKEMNLNITNIDDMTTPNTWRDALINWFADASNGIKSLVVQNEICVDDQCLTKSDIQNLLQLEKEQGDNSASGSSTDTTTTTDSDATTTVTGDDGSAQDQSPQASAPVVTPPDTTDGSTQSPDGPSS